MACNRCLSERHSKFPTEMNIHFPGYAGLAIPTVWAFPEVAVCLNGGSSEFTVPERELEVLLKGMPALKGQRSVSGDFTH
jgi:hypothetical protein